MLTDLDNYQHEYYIEDDKIKYFDIDHYSTDIVKGYKTLFAYYYEY